MSYELNFHFKYPHDVKIAWKRLECLSIMVDTKEDMIALKDPDLSSSWNYDVRIFMLKDCELLIELNNKSSKLFEALKSAMDEIDCYIYENNDPELACSLEDIFRAYQK